jgi:hypothetical protein
MEKNNYSMICKFVIPMLSNKNVTFVDVKENRDVYIRTIEEDIKKVFQIADIPKLKPSIGNWEVKIGEEKIILNGIFLGIGTTREIGNRKDPSFYQFKHKSETRPDISRIHCILYFYEEFVIVVDLWSYHGTDVVINRNIISSIKGGRKMIKITNIGEIILRHCSSAKNITVKKIENEDKIENKDKIENEDKIENDLLKSVRTCVICMNNPQTHIIIPCGHKCLCEKCSIEYLEKINICPICRQNVQKLQRVFET